MNNYMQSNPKKSKALIITFIAILILLIAGYFIFKNSDKLFGTKNSTNISKLFAPLLGTSKEKPADTLVVDNQPAGGDTTGTTTGPGGTTGTTTGPGGTTGTTTGPGGTGGVIIPPPILIPPPFNPIPTPTTDCKDKNGNLIPCTNDLPSTDPTQCSDGVDNDKDRLADMNDPGCHTDFNANNALSYDRYVNDESRKKDTSATTIGGMCPDDPLVFTEDEKAQLATLLRQYYLLAPTLRIEDDITLLDYDNQINEELVKQATILLNDCKDQKADPAYTGPREVKDNPYYQNPIPNSGAEYLRGYGLYEMLFNIW